MRKNKDPKLMAIDSKIGLRWKEYRKKAGLTLKQVADKMRAAGYYCHPATINRLETGKSQPDHFQTFLMLACDIYKVTPDELFGAVQERSEDGKQD